MNQTYIKNLLPLNIMNNLLKIMMLGPNIKKEYDVI